MPGGPREPGCLVTVACGEWSVHGCGTSACGGVWSVRGSVSPISGSCSIRIPCGFMMPPISTGWFWW